MHEVAESLGTQLLSIGRILSTRWVASSERTIRAVWNNYEALLKHFDNAANDSSRDSREKAMYKGLATRMTTFAFVNNLAIMYDALEELADLSRHLQRREINVIDAHRLVSREIIVMESLKNGNGRHFKEIVGDTSTFRGIELHRGSKCDLSINITQFFQSLANNLRSRLLSNSTESASQHADTQLIQNLKSLYPEHWPESVSICSNDQSVRYLCDRFMLDTSTCIQGIREFIENGGKRVPKDLRPLINTASVIPVSTAEC